MSLFRVSFIAIASASLGGCAWMLNLHPAKAVRMQGEVYPIAAGDRLKLTGFNGRIRVKPGAPGEVRIERTITCRARTEEEARAGLEMVAPTVKQEASFLAIEFRPPLSTRHRFHMEISATVPAETHLDLRGSNGSLDVEGIRGAIDARTGNGAVRARDGGASAVYVHTSNGEIVLERMGGAVQAHTSNGRVVVRDCKGPVTAETSNGEVVVDSEPAATAGIEVRNSNGRIRCLLPASFSGEIDAHTSNGRVRCDFPVDSSRKEPKHRLHGRIGRGGTLVRLWTSNGSIEILGCDRRLERGGKADAPPPAAGDEVWKL